jgi:adenylate cyclase
MTKIGLSFGKTEVQFHRPTPTNAGKQARNLESDTLTSAVHERRLTSVLVVDMRNFTALTQQLDEKVLSSLIGSWFRHAGSIIRSSGSWVDKYIGDAIMAIWFHGQQEISQDDILQIFQAITQLYNMTCALSEQYPLPFKLRIGAAVNTRLCHWWAILVVVNIQIIRRSGDDSQRRFSFRVGY